MFHQYRILTPKITLIQNVNKITISENTDTAHIESKVQKIEVKILEIGEKLEVLSDRLSLLNTLQLDNVHWE